MQSVMPPSHSFSQVPEAEIQRSSFDRSHGLKTTFDAGYLIPIYVDEALPGDTFNLRLNAFARLATPIKPIMDNMFLETFFFAVPLRLIWTNFPKFMGEQANPADSTSFVTPKMATPGAPGVLSQSLSDYLGIPVGIATISPVSFWHRAYNLIWNSWFRDSNLQNSVTVDLGDGPDTYSNYALLRRGKRHDYFTSCLPWPQKGTAVSIPLGTSAPVTSTNALIQFYSESELSVVRNLNVQATSAVTITGTAPSPTNQRLLFGPVTGLQADLTSATAATINSLRQAFQLQRLYERDARGGTRYIEIVRAHFNVTSPDLRATRPLYLGGGSTPININPVSQTSVSGTTPQGNLAAFGTVTALGHGFTQSFTEHCVLLGLASVRADLTYQKGLERMFSRNTRFDFYWPALAHIGEQAVLNQEIWCVGNGVAGDTLTFGYQERFAEYRYKPSKITGLLRSDVSSGSTSLDIWHLSQDFATLPTLSTTFIQDDPPIDRVIAVPAEPHFIYDSYIKLICARPMPVFGVPGLIDHF